MSKSSENWLLGIVIGLGIFFVALMLTFFLRSFLQSSEFNSSNDPFVKKDGSGPVKGDFSLQQAYVVCKSKVQSMGHLQIQSLRLDGQSSRFDAKTNQFIVFLDLDLIRDREIVDEFARCHVSAADNSIAEFRLKGNRSFLGGW